MLIITASFNLEESSSWPKSYVGSFIPHPSPPGATTKALCGRIPEAELPSPQQTWCTVWREKVAVKHWAPTCPCTVQVRLSEAILLGGPRQGASGCGSGLETLPSTLTQYSVLSQPLPHLPSGCPGSINGRRLLGEAGSIHCNERILPLGWYIWPSIPFCRDNQPLVGAAPRLLLILSVRPDSYCNFILF